MPEQRPAARHSAPIRTPDQLQQSKRDDAPKPAAAPAPQPEPPPAGILGQLATERAHD